MNAWTDDELRRVGDATGLQLATRRSDGTLRRYTTMWVVRVGDNLYVRSAGGPGRAWYRNALASGTGRIRAAGIERDVSFGCVDAALLDAIDATYHANTTLRTRSRQPRSRPRRTRRHRSSDQE